MKVNSGATYTPAEPDSQRGKAGSGGGMVFQKDDPGSVYTMENYPGAVSNGSNKGRKDNLRP